MRRRDRWEIETIDLTTKRYEEDKQVETSGVKAIVKRHWKKSLIIVGVIYLVVVLFGVFSARYYYDENGNRRLYRLTFADMQLQDDYNTLSDQLTSIRGILTDVAIVDIHLANGKYTNYAFEKDENVVFAVNTTDYSGYMIFVFENGKVAKVPLDSYETKTNRKKLANAYSGKAKLVKMFWIKDNVNIMLRTTNGRAMIFDTSLLMPKASRETIGVQAMICKAKFTVEKAFILTDEKTAELSKYRSKTIPVAGSFAKDIEDPDQMSLI